MLRVIQIGRDTLGVGTGCGGGMIMSQEIHFHFLNADFCCSGSKRPWFEAMVCFCKTLFCMT